MFGVNLVKSMETKLHENKTNIASLSEVYSKSFTRNELFQIFPNTKFVIRDFVFENFKKPKVPVKLTV